MKGLLPTFRKRNRLTAPDTNRRSSLQDEGLITAKDVTYHHASRSLDESSDSSIASKRRSNSCVPPPRSFSDDPQHDSIQAYYYWDSDGFVSPPSDEVHSLSKDTARAFGSAKAVRRGRLQLQESFSDGLDQEGSSLIDTKMVDQEGITSLTRHVRNFSYALRELRESFSTQEDFGSLEDVKGLAHNRLGEVVLILKGVIQRYPTLNPTEILTSAGNVIRKVKEHDYSTNEEPEGFFEATDQLALAFSNSVSDYLEEDLSQRTGQANSDITSIEHLQGTAGYDEFDEKRNFSEMGGDFTEFYEDRSERAESEESLDKSEFDTDKRLSINLDPRVVNEADNDKNVKPDLSAVRAEELDRTLLSIEGSVDISLQRTKVWSKYAKDIISYMERRSHIESEYYKQLSRLAQATKSVITEESYLPFQSTYITALEHDITSAKKYQDKLQQELKGKIIEQLTSRRSEHDRIRSKLKEKWNKECKKLNESIMNLSKSKSLYIQKQQELKKFVDKQEKVEGGQSTSVVPSFSIGKKKKEEDVAKRAEEAEEYYRKCVDEANVRQHDKEKTREDVLLELRQLVYQCDMTMRAVTCGYFQMMEQLVSHLPQQYSALAKDSKQSEIGKQFAEFIKLQQTTSKKSTPKRFSFELYVADDRTNSDKGYIGPADLLNVGSPDPDQKDSPRPKEISRRISTASAGSDTSLNRPSSPIPTKKRQNAWGAPNRYSNSDDTASISSRSLPGSPSGSPNLERKDPSQRLSLSNTDMDVREEFKKELAGPFRKLKMSRPAQTHKFKKLRSSSKCKKCDSYVYFNGAECELCGLTCHKKCLETLAIKCGKSRLPRKMTTFGVDFQKHLDATRRKKIPIIMEKCITEIDLRCLQFRGIYRVSGVKTKVEALSQQFETAGSAVDLQSTHPHLITSVLKLYLRELPEPLMSFDLYPDFIKIAKESTGLKFNRTEDGDADHNEEHDGKCEDLLRKLHECILRLPSANHHTVVRLLNHLRRVANNEEFNQMNCSNLAIIFGPTLLRPRGSPSSLSALMDMPHQVRVVELLLWNTKMLDDSIESGRLLDDEKDTLLIDNEDNTKDSTKRTSSVQSEQDLGYNTQPDQLDDGKPELSLSDEIQLDYPDIFKRSCSSRREIASPFGSLDSVPDMSPDIDEELKDIVAGNPFPDRPKSLGLDDRDQVISPQNFRSGSDSNLSFNSLSPIEIPDSSMDFGTNLTKDESSGSRTQLIPGQDSNTKDEQDSGIRLRRKGQASRVSSGNVPFQAIDCTMDKKKEAGEQADNGVKGKQEIDNARLVNENNDNKYVDDVVATDKGLENQDGVISLHDGSMKGVIGHELANTSSSKPEDGVNMISCPKGADKESCKKFTAEECNNIDDDSTDSVVLSVLRCEEILEQDCEKEMCKQEISSEKAVDGQGTHVPRKQVAIGPLSIKVSSSSRYRSEVPVAKKDSSLKKPPKVAPKPTSPTQTCDSSTDVGDESAGPTKQLNISGNTRKLRDRFTAESGTFDNDMKQGNLKHGQAKDNQVNQSPGQTREKAQLCRSVSSTAKLVEKFTKETEKRTDDREESPGKWTDGREESQVTRSVMSVREMLKHFESGDEMDDDEVQTPQKKNSYSRERVTNTSGVMGEGEPVKLLREQKELNIGNKDDETIRNTSDFAGRREPKFV